MRRAAAHRRASQASARIVQHRSRPHARTYLGPGKLEELRALRTRSTPRCVVCDDELTPYQQRALEDTLEMRVVDRTRRDPRHLRGRTRTPPRASSRSSSPSSSTACQRMRGLWKHLERLGGGVGTRGPGESQLETDRRLARTAIQLLQAPARARASQHRAHRAQAARALRDAVRLARRLHQRRQVDAAERAHRRRGVVGRPPVRDARPDHARLRLPRPHVHAHRHRRLHPQAAARPRRGVRVHARGDARGRPASCTSPTPRRRRTSGAAQQRRRRGGAGRDRRG